MMIQFAKTGVTVGDERVHPSRFGERQRLIFAFQRLRFHSPWRRPQSNTERVPRCLEPKPMGQHQSISGVSGRLIHHAPDQEISHPRAQQNQSRSAVIDFDDIRD